MSRATIILTGFMGTGKSTVGKLLAEQSGREFIDTDAWIESLEGRSIARIFAESGEERFRALERRASREFAGRRNLVIATGGKLMLDPTNAALLAEGAHVFCLHAHPDVIMSRLAHSGDERPLLAAGDPLERVRALLAERRSAYARYEPLDTSGKTPQEIVSGVLQALPEVPTPIPVVLPVTHPAGQYHVIIGRNILARWRVLSDCEAPAAVITDSNVGPLYAEVCGPVGTVLTIPAGEQHKTLATVSRLYDGLLAADLDRTGVVLALGGGVVGDVAGFAAATYLRGVPLIQCPTSLLAMVDAGVGGKTGVDLPQGKNLVGAFKQPEIVLADTAVLATLPQKEFSAGLAEVVKSALIARPQLLEKLEQEEWGASVASSPVSAGRLQELIAGAIRVKRDIVQEDPFEKGRRALLNLGHTFAHAIEQVSGYRVSHGEAVAMGLRASAHLSQRLGYCRPGLELRIAAVLTRCRLPITIPAHLDPQALIKAMQSDKKKVAGHIRFILLRAVGEPFICGDVPSEEVSATLRHLAGSD